MALPVYRIPPPWPQPQTAPLLLAVEYPPGVFSALTSAGDSTGSVALSGWGMLTLTSAGASSGTVTLYDRNALGPLASSGQGGGVFTFVPLPSYELPRVVVTLAPTRGPAGVVARFGSSGRLGSRQSGRQGVTSTHGTLGTAKSGSLVRSGSIGHGG